MSTSNNYQQEVETCCQRRALAGKESGTYCCQCGTFTLENLSLRCLKCHHPLVPEGYIGSNSRNQSGNTIHQKETEYSKAVDDLYLSIKPQSGCLGELPTSSHRLSQLQTVDPRTLSLIDRPALHTHLLDNGNVIPSHKVVMAPVFDEVESSDPKDFGMEWSTAERYKGMK